MKPKPQLALSLLQQLRRRSPTHASSRQGFTTIEVLVVIVMIGILTAIAAPSWLSFVNNRRVR
ncbi:MAG: prepilin-type N-terminal cleavage/methylation domain-containing protein, partial [Phormidium sp. GEM2.Bin31]